MKRDYKVEVTRNGRWWIVYVPEIDRLTQARRVKKLEEVARTLIAISTATPPSEIGITIARIHVAHLGDVAETATTIRSLRAQALGIEAEAVSKTVDYAKRLSDAKIPVRDIAELLGLSPQRVSQLTHVSPQ